MNWYIVNMLGLAGLFYLCYLLAKAIEKFSRIDLNYDIKRIKNILKNGNE